MFLKRASFRHYRSMDTVDVDFDPITVLVGPNGVGKSNFVDGLRFFRDVARDGLDHAIIGREGIDRIRQNYKSRPFNVNFSFEFSAKHASPTSATYQMTLAGKEGDYRIESESCQYISEKHVWPPEDNSSDPVLASRPARFERHRDGELLIDSVEYEKRIRPETAALGTFVDFEELGGPVVAFARDWTFCALYPNTLRKLSPPVKEDRLSEDGSNWASVVRALRRTKDGRASLERIAEVMRAALPGYQEVTVSPAGSYLVPILTLENGPDGKPQKFDPVQLSDGTLRVFGILLALYQQPAPKLLIIEEPEQTVHPGVLAALAEAFKEASQRTQIVLTTHSPQLIDQFSPDCVRVAWMKDGLTRVSKIRGTQVAAVKKHLMSLQEFMSAEGLQPDESIA